MVKEAREAFSGSRIRAGRHRLAQACADL